MTNNTENEKKENSANAKSGDPMSESASVKNDSKNSEANDKINITVQKSENLITKAFLLGKAATKDFIDEVKQINQIRKDTVAVAAEGATKRDIAKTFWTNLDERKKSLLVAVACIIIVLIWKLQQVQLILLVTGIAFLFFYIYRSWKAGIDMTYLCIGIVFLILPQIISRLVIASAMYGRVPSLWQSPDMFFEMFFSAPSEAVAGLDILMGNSFWGKVCFWGGIGLIGYHFYKRKIPKVPEQLTHIKCPHCKELVLKDATICKHCSSRLFPDATTKAE